MSRVYPELVQARFPKGLFAKLIREAEVEETTVSEYVRSVIKRHIDGREPRAA